MVYGTKEEGKRGDGGDFQPRRSARVRGGHDNEDNDDSQPQTETQESAASKPAEKARNKRYRAPAEKPSPKRQKGSESEGEDDSEQATSLESEGEDDSEQAASPETTDDEDSAQATSPKTMAQLVQKLLDVEKDLADESKARLAQSIKIMGLERQSGRTSSIDYLQGRMYQFQGNITQWSGAVCGKIKEVIPLSGLQHEQAEQVLRAIPGYSDKFRSNARKICLAVAGSAIDRIFYFKFSPDGPFQHFEQMHDLFASRVTDEANFRKLNEWRFTTFDYLIERPDWIQLITGNDTAYERLLGKSPNARAYLTARVNQVTSEISGLVHALLGIPAQAHTDVLLRRAIEDTFAAVCEYKLQQDRHVLIWPKVDTKEALLSSPCCAALCSGPQMVEKDISDGLAATAFPALALIDPEGPKQIAYMNAVVVFLRESVQVLESSPPGEKEVGSRNEKARNTEKADAPSSERASNPPSSKKPVDAPSSETPVLEKQKETKGKGKVPVKPNEESKPHDAATEHSRTTPT